MECFLKDLKDSEKLPEPRGEWLKVIIRKGENGVCRGGSDRRLRGCTEM